MQNKFSGKPKPQIGQKRFLDPDSNKLSLDKYHQKQATEKKKSLSSKVRDVKRLLQFADSHAETADPGKLQLLQGRLKDLNKVKRDKRKTQFIDQQYKNVKFFGKRRWLEMKRVRKQLKKVEGEPDSEEKKQKIADLRSKIVYIKVQSCNSVLP